MIKRFEGGSHGEIRDAEDENFACNERIAGKQTRIIQSLFLNWFLCWEEMGLRQNEKAYTTTLRL